MSFKIVCNEIAQVKTGAVVIGAEQEPVCGSGIDKKIYRAADTGKLLEAREKIGVIRQGAAAATKSYGLPARFVIHTVLPDWCGGSEGELDILQSCYRESLKLALKLRCRSVAFALLAADKPGFPRDQVLEIALRSFRDFLDAHEMEILLVIPDREMLVLAKAPDETVGAFIDSHYLPEPFESLKDSAEPSLEDWNVPDGAIGSSYPQADGDSGPRKYSCGGSRYGRSDKAGAPLFQSSLRENSSQAAARRLQEVVDNVGESFRGMLFRLIDERKMSDPDVYKRANLDRKLFSKIRCNPDYCPSKKTVIALAIALKLDPVETTDLLARAGYAFSPCNIADLIVEFCIENGIYDIYEVDMLLFKYGQPTLF